MTLDVVCPTAITATFPGLCAMKLSWVWPKESVEWVQQDLKSFCILVTHCRVRLVDSSLRHRMSGS